MASLRELEGLDREQCLELLRKVLVGRLVFTEHALPEVQPVDFRCWRGDVVIRIADPAARRKASHALHYALRLDWSRAPVYARPSRIAPGFSRIEDGKAGRFAYN